MAPPSDQWHRPLMARCADELGVPISSSTTRASHVSPESFRRTSGTDLGDQPVVGFPPAPFLPGMKAKRWAATSHRLGHSLVASPTSPLMSRKHGGRLYHNGALEARRIGLRSLHLTRTSGPRSLAKIPNDGHPRPNPRAGIRRSAGCATDQEVARRGVAAFELSWPLRAHSITGSNLIMDGAGRGLGSCVCSP